MLKRIKYNGKEVTLKPYNTLIERDVLLYTSGEYDFDALFSIFENNISINEPFKLSELSKLEKLYFILELKSISVSEIFPFIKKCSKCGQKFDFEIAFENVLKEGKLEEFKGIKVTEAFSDDINDYVDIDADELDIEDYDELEEYIENNKTKFDFTGTTICPHCKNEEKVILTEEHLVKNLSEDTLANFYQTISSMVYYGKYSKLDIDSMLPFERSIYLSLLNEEIKKNSPGGA